MGTRVDRRNLLRGLNLLDQLMSLAKAEQTKVPGTQQESLPFRAPDPSVPTPTPKTSGPQLKLPGMEPKQTAIPESSKPKAPPVMISSPAKREHEGAPAMVGQPKPAGGLEVAAGRAQAAGPKMETRSSGIVVPSREVLTPEGERPTLGGHLGHETMMAKPPETSKIVSPPGIIVPEFQQPKPVGKLVVPEERTTLGTAGRQKEIVGEGTRAVADLPPGPERTAAMKQGAAVLGSRIRERVAAAPPAARGGPSAPAVLETPPAAGLPTGEGPTEPEEPGEPEKKEGPPKGPPSSGWDPFRRAAARSKLRGPNVLGWYGFGHALGATAATPAGGATQLGMLTGRGVAQVHGLLNRRAMRGRYGYRGEMTRLGREAELTRRAQLGRMEGEAGGMVTQSAMRRSLFVQVSDEELSKSRIRPKKPKSRIFVSIYSNPALFGRGKKEKDKEPTDEFPSLMPKTPKPRTITLFGKAKEIIPDPQNEDLQPDEEDGVASVLVGDDDLVTKADRELIIHHEKKMMEHQTRMVASPTNEEANQNAEAMGLHLLARGRIMRGDARAGKTSIEANAASAKIKKAGAAQESTGRWTLEDPLQARREHEQGLYRQPVGVSGGPTPDLPERGRDWHGTVPGVPDEPEDESEEEVKKIWGAPKPIFKEEKESEPVIKKALVPYYAAQHRAQDILKALPDLSVGLDLTPREVEFLKSQGVNEEDIIRGRVDITPRMQTEFQRFMTDRVFKSLSGLRRL